MRKSGKKTCANVINGQCVSTAKISHTTVVWNVEVNDVTLLQRSYPTRWRDGNYYRSMNDATAPRVIYRATDNSVHCYFTDRRL